MDKLTRRGFAAGALALGATGPAWGRCRIRRPDMWHSGVPLDFQVQEIYPGTLNGRVYLAGGLSAAADNPNGISDLLLIGDMGESNDGTLSLRLNEACYSPIWRQAASLPEPRHHPNLVGHQGAIYAIGGFHAANGGRWSMLARNTRYEPATDTWIEMAAMPAPFGETVAVSLASGLHVATGRQPNGRTNANWRDHGDVGAHYVYDASEDRWHDAAPNPNPRNSATGGVLSGRMHVVGGRAVNGGNLDHHEAYDPLSDRWSSRAPLPQASGGLAAAVARGKLYAFGGEYFGAGGGGVYKECWIYDPQADAWTAGPDMATPRHGLGGVAIGGTILAIGGAIRAGGSGTSDLVEVLMLTGE
jgi:hypothetical protein